ncbi:MAG TPA: hypothetical protein VGP08_16065 [Pyrinomonadaceae bacterium]|jgi:hypothetical protein|nr:hypothetical protein [Pyrinomonadaceae bacterium]
MPQRYKPGDLITADIINDILTRLENLDARLAALEDRKNHAKETKEKEKEKEKDNQKESKEKDTKETKEKDTKETKEKDTKEGKDTKDTKDTKEKDTKESKDTKDTKEKDTKESKEKDTKEGKDTKDTKEQSKDTKEQKEGKENKENKEEKEEKEQKDRTKEHLSLKEKDRDQPFAPFGDAPPAMFGLDAAEEYEEPCGRAFISEDERPQVGRLAFKLADKQDDKLPESNATGKQAEAFN